MDPRPRPTTKSASASSQKRLAKLKAASPSVRQMPATASTVLLPTLSAKTPMSKRGDHETNIGGKEDRPALAVAELQLLQQGRQRGSFQVVDEAKDEEGIEAADGEQPEMGGREGSGASGFGLGGVDGQDGFGVPFLSVLVVL